MAEAKLISSLRQRLLEESKTLSKEKLQDVLEFVEFVKLKEDKAFIHYVNERTQKALSDKESGEIFKDLKALQAEYGKI